MRDAYIAFAQRNPALFRLMFAHELVDIAKQASRVLPRRLVAKAFDLWTRETLCYRKYEGIWRIIHDHVSVPIDLDTNVGVTDFKP